MDKPRILWYVRKDNEPYTSGKEYYAGTYTKEKKMVLKFQVWNNRWGKTDVQDLKNATLVMRFSTLEDSALLQCCKVILNDYDQIPLVIKNSKAMAMLGVTLSGKSNNGDEHNQLNKNNFINLTFEFDASDYELKHNDLKNLYFELISQE